MSIQNISRSFLASLEEKNIFDFIDIQQIDDIFSNSSLWLLNSSLLMNILFVSSSLSYDFRSKLKFTFYYYIINIASFKYRVVKIQLKMNYLHLPLYLVEKEENILEEWV